jgi:hypothetical protein
MTPEELEELRKKRSDIKKYQCSWPGCSKLSPPLEPAQLFRRGGKYFCPTHAQYHSRGIDQSEDLEEIQKRAGEYRRSQCSWPGCSKLSPPLEPAQIARRGGLYYCPEHAQFRRVILDPSEDLVTIRKRKSDIAKRYFETHPEIKLDLSNRMKRYYELHPEARKIRGDALKKSRPSPDEMSRRFKVLWEDPEYRKKITERARELWSDPEYRKNHSKLMKKCFEDRRWMGSVKYYDGPQYCEKWTPELRERVRAWFGYKCVECGTPQNGQKLSVHHVWYNKKLCCDDSPRFLVALCNTCHSKTSNVRKDKRNELSQHFQDIIDNDYDGRCWYTREEMLAFK